MKRGRPDGIVGSDGRQVRRPAHHPPGVSTAALATCRPPAAGDVSPSTLYFSDRPERVVGHLTTQQFVEQWTEGPNSFAEDPPNAVLSYVDAGADVPEDAVVILRDPVASEGSLTYSIEVLDGVVPAESGAVTLFIDPLGRPLSPVSLAGMNRRGRRRDRAASSTERQAAGDARDHSWRPWRRCCRPGGATSPWRAWNSPTPGTTPGSRPFRCRTLVSAVRKSVAEVDGGGLKELKAALAEAQQVMSGG
jgi:hypothetical protein